MKDHPMELYIYYYYDPMGNRVARIGMPNQMDLPQNVGELNKHCTNDGGIHTNDACNTCYPKLGVYAEYYAREANGKELAKYKTTPHEGYPSPNGCVNLFALLNLEEWYVYGSSVDGRIATVEPHLGELDEMFVMNAKTDAQIEYPLESGFSGAGHYHQRHRNPNYRHYEMKDHLGNVRAIVDDTKVPKGTAGNLSTWLFAANVSNIFNYYPFGKLYPGNGIYNRLEDYSFGFNGMRRDDDIKEKGGVYNHGARLISNDVPMWFSRDPLEGEYPWSSPYVAFGNNPVLYIDPDEKKIFIYNSSPEILIALDLIMATDIGKELLENYIDNPDEHIHIGLYDSGIGGGEGQNMEIKQ